MHKGLKTYKPTILNGPEDLPGLFQNIKTYRVLKTLQDRLEKKLILSAFSADKLCALSVKVMQHSALF